MPRPKKHRGDEQLVAALTCGATQENAARQAGVSLRTVHRRLADPEFRRALQTFRADIVQRTAGALTAAGLEFVKTLVGLVSAGVPPATRLGAARSGLEIGMKLREHSDMEQRLGQLERDFEAEKGQKPGR